MKCLVSIIMALWLIGLIVACQHSRNEADTDINLSLFTMEDFQHEMPLTGDRFMLDSLMRPVLLKVIPDRNALIVLEKDGGSLGKVFTLDSLHYVKSFINVGRDPESQLLAFGIQYIVEEGALFIADPIKRQLFVYSIDSLVCQACANAPNRVIDFNNEIIRPHILGIGTIVDLHPSFHKDSIGALQFFDRNGSFERYFGKYPLHKNKYAPYDLVSVFMSGLNLSKDRQYILMNYHYADYFDIYGEKGEHVLRVQGPGSNEPVFKQIKLHGGTGVVPDSKSLRSYIGDAHMDNVLLVLYGGMSANEGASHGDLLYQFDDSFQPELLYHLGTPIFMFDIDWSTKTLYGLTDKLGEYQLVKYQLQ